MTTFTLNTLCEKLIKTYNTTIIDQMPYVLQQALYNDASSCSTGSYKQNEKDRTVLAELIHNHFAKKTQREELSQHYIGGPMTLTCHWSETYQKLIYIFGEEHSEETDCKEFPKNKGKNEEQSGMLIEEFLKKLTEINDIYLDILVELPAFRQKQLKYSKPLSEHEGLADARLFKIGTAFSECMDGYDRNQQKCSRSRIHYIDIRNIEREPGDGLDALSIFIITCFNIFDDEKKDANQKKIDLLNFTISPLGQHLMKGFLIPKANKKEYLEFWNSFALDNYYVKKELDHNDKQMSEKIYNFLKEEIQQKLDKKYDDETETTSVLINQKTKLIETELIKYQTGQQNVIEPQTILEYFYDLMYLVLSTNSLLVDFYTLSRIFKRFNLQPDNPQKRRTTDEPETPSNIIIYAGNNHCNMYRKFLKEIGFSLIADIGKAKSTPRNCIDMTEHDIYGTWSLQPLFSAWPPLTQPSLRQAESKKEQETKAAFLDAKAAYEIDTVNGGFGAIATNADHKRKARKKTGSPY